MILFELWNSHILGKYVMKMLKLERLNKLKEFDQMMMHCGKRSPHIGR